MTTNSTRTTSPMQTAKPGQTSLLEVTDLRASYGTAEVLHGIELHIDAGEIVCLARPQRRGTFDARESRDGPCYPAWKRAPGGCRDVGLEDLRFSRVMAWPTWPRRATYSRH